MHEEANAVVRLAGAMDMGSVAGAHAELKQAAAAGTGVMIDLEDVTEADITLIQLIESARRTYAEAGLAIRLAAPAAGPVLETLERGGFLSDAADARAQFWRAL